MKCGIDSIPLFRYNGTTLSGIVPAYDSLSEKEDEG